MGAVRQFVDDLFRPLSLQIAKTFNLPKFLNHAPVFYISLAAYTVVFLTAPYFSRLLFPKAYSTVSKRHTYGWRVHMVSMSHAVVIVPWAFWMVNQNMPAVENDKAFGWDDRLGDLQAVSAAYFVWDTVESALSRAGIDFTLHGLACTIIWMIGYRPFTAYYGPRALLWELSTPFLNIHWFLDKVGKTGTPLQMVNAGFLLAAFFGARLVYGPFLSYDFLRTMWSVRHEMSPFVTGSFAAGNIVLNILNFWWFSKMIGAIQKRFKKDPIAEGSAPTNYGTVSIDGQTLQLPEGETLQAALHVQET